MKETKLNLGKIIIPQNAPPKDKLYKYKENVLNKSHDDMNKFMSMLSKVNSINPNKNKFYRVRKSIIERNNINNKN